jgi:ABC-2 type transport system permease protein
VRTLRFLLRKEFLQIARDRTMLGMLIAAPVIQLLVLSSATTFEVRSTKMYLVDHDRSSASRGLVERMVASGRFRVAEASASAAKGDEALLDREVAMIMAIPADFERDLVRTGMAPVQLIFNAEDGAAAGIVRSYSTRIIARYSEELSSRIRPLGGDRADGASPRIEVRSRGWYNPRLNYTHFMVPGILVLLVTVIATAMAAMNIVREKEIGTLEQLNVTPITKAEFIASKLIPFWIIAMVDLGVGLGVGRVVFGIPVRGSLLLVFGGAAIYLLAALGIGLWVSTIAQTQQQAMFISFAMNMIYLLMSGLFTPLRSMPRWAQMLAEISPMKHFIVIMRGVLVKGAGLADIQVPLLVLLVYGVGMLTLAVRSYSKTTA